MPDNLHDIPPEALAAARTVVDALHERLLVILAGLPHDTPIAADLGEEFEQ